MSKRVQVVVFDVNETLSDMEPLRQLLIADGAPGYLLETWFAATLRDGFALAASGAQAPFSTIAMDNLRTVLSPLSDLRRPVEVVATAVLDGFSGLSLHTDVAAGLRVLVEAGLRLVTLTNGSASLAEKLLDRDGVADLVEQRLSVQDAGHWKPHPMAYRYAGERCGVAVDQMCMVAVHPWDVDGAKRAGMLSAWLDRKGAPYPQAFLTADATAQDMAELAHRICDL